MANALDELAFRIRLDRPYDEALELARVALKAEGFGVISEIDMKATLKAKIGVEFRSYAILGVCHPAFAHRALSAEPEIGLFLPCNVIVYETEGQAGSAISIVDPLQLLGGIEDEDLLAVAEDAHARLARAATALQG